MITNKTALRSAILAATLVPAVSMASGYKLNEQSAGGMGTAHAGRAAMAEDASVVFYNPAAMTELKSAQMTAGTTYIEGDGEFEGSGQNAAQFPSSFEGYNNGGDFLGSSFIPFVYSVMPVTSDLALGLGVFVPFGTNTDYDDGFVGGQFADETSLRSLEIQPSVAYKINDQLSVGGGIDIIYIEGLLSKDVDLIPFNSQVPALSNTDYIGPENHYEVSGDDWAIGWNLGVYYKLSDSTTFGFAYRSEIDVELTGDSEFETTTGLEVYNSQAGAVVAIPNARAQASKVPLTTPQSATFSLVHQLTEELKLQAGATWTGWSSFQNFDVIATENAAGGLGDGATDPSDLAGLGNGYIGHIDESWVDVWAIAFGGTYQLNDRLALRAGYAYDQSPVRDEYRTARVPSSDRQWLTFGAGYKLDQNLSFDVAAGYLFMYPMDLSEVNKTLDNQQKDAAELNGEYEIDVFGLSAQVNYAF